MGQVDPGKIRVRERTVCLAGRQLLAKPPLACALIFMSEMLICTFKPGWILLQWKRKEESGR